MSFIVGRAVLSSCVGILILGLLGGCSHHRLSSTQGDVSPLWFEHLAILEAMGPWTFQGRIAVKDGADSWSVKLNWTQANDQFDIRIIAPFGQGAAHLYGNNELAVIDVPERPSMSAVSAEALLLHNIGWAVPLEGLRYWLAGRPDPALVMSAQWDELGRLNQLTQSGWHIKYRRYVNVAGVDLPRKIEMVNDQLRVKFIIDRWQLDS